MSSPFRAIPSICFRGPCPIVRFDLKYVLKETHRITKSSEDRTRLKFFNHVFKMFLLIKNWERFSSQQLYIILFPFSFHRQQNKEKKKAVLGLDLDLNVSVGISRGNSNPVRSHPWKTSFHAFWTSCL